MSMSNYPARVKLDPEKDGITHINVYSRGRTQLGVFLSNFPYTPFEHPTYGHFASMEAFWHYISTGCRLEGIRTLTGIEAKHYAKGYPQVTIPNFHEEIKFAIECKINAYPLHKAKLLLNTLPLRHYFVFSGNVVVDQPHFIWQTKHIEALAEKWRLET